jgi:hypothetical protein
MNLVVSNVGTQIPHFQIIGDDLTDQRNASYFTSSCFVASSNDGSSPSSRQSELFYDWRFTPSQFVLDPRPLGITTRDLFFQLSPCDHSPYVTSFLKKGSVCPFQLALALASAVILMFRVPWDSWPHFTVSDSRLPQLGGPSPRIYIPWEQNGPIIPLATGSSFCRLLRLTGLRWRYSNPPPHGHKISPELLVLVI